MQRLLNVNEVAKCLGISIHTLNRWRSTGSFDLPFVRVGRRIKYVEADLINWINENRESINGKSHRKVNKS